MRFRSYSPLHNAIATFAVPALLGIAAGSAIFVAFAEAPRAAKPLAFSAPASPFRSCAEARAAHAAPVYRGDPRYGSWLDADSDGVGCEPYFP